MVSGSQRSSGESPYTTEELSRLEHSEKKLLDIGDRVVILDERNFPNQHVTVEKLFQEVLALKARTGTTRAFVLVDYLQVFPIPVNESRNHRTDLDADKWRIGAMKALRDYLDDGDAVMVISEAWKPSGAGDKRAGMHVDLVGAARAAYTPDIVFWFAALTDEELDHLGESRESLQSFGLSLNKLIIAKGRDGITKLEIPLSFWFKQSKFTEERVDSNDPLNVYRLAHISQRATVKR